jgi:hypothetical protein
MKKMIVLVVISLVSFALVGCSDFTSPEGILKTAYVALNKDNSVDFRGTLTGDASERFGSLEGMGELKEKLTGRTLSFGDTDVKSLEQDYRGFDKLRLYDIQVLAKEGENRLPVFKSFMHVSVICDVMIHFHRYGVKRWDDRYWDADEVIPVETLFCKISDLRFD